MTLFTSQCFDSCDENVVFRPNQPRNEPDSPGVLDQKVGNSKKS